MPIASPGSSLPSLSDLVEVYLTYRRPTGSTVLGPWKQPLIGRACPPRRPCTPALGHGDQRGSRRDGSGEDAGTHVPRVDAEGRRNGVSLRRPRDPPLLAEELPLPARHALRDD